VGEEALGAAAAEGRSSSLRTRQTLEAIASSLGKSSSVEFEPQLYAASEGELLERSSLFPSLSIR
jgi:phosphohistidine phosphatase SixA